MKNNPYAPPNSTVADVESGIPVERPRIVVNAVRLLWLSFLLDLPESIYPLFTPDPEISTGVNIVATLFGWLLGFGLAYWLYTAAWKGRSWSRYVLALLMILGAVAMYFLQKYMPEIFEVPTYIGTLRVITTLLSAFAIGMLFAPSANAWYRAVRGR